MRELKLFLILILYCQNINGQNSLLITGKGFEGVIFTSDYEVFPTPPQDQRFTPSKEEIEKLEYKLRGEIKSLNKARINQGRDLGPVLHKNLKKYVRQYIGYITPEGERIIFINFLWNKLNLIERIRGYSLALIEGWQEELLNVHDGGSRYWQIKYNLGSEEFFDLYVNGIA